MRKHRDARAARFGYDLRAIFEDAKKREKELTKLRDARDEHIAARKAMERANGGVAKLAEAAKTLAQAQTQASNILAEACMEATKLVEDAQRKAGNTVMDRENITRDTNVLAKKVESFNKTSITTIKEFERREARVTKREKDIARARDDLGKDQNAMRTKHQRVDAAMKG